MKIFIFFCLKILSLIKILEILKFFELKFFLARKKLKNYITI